MLLSMNVICSANPMPNFGDEIVVDLPVKGKKLDLAVCNEKICLWTEISEDRFVEPYEIFVFTDKQEMSEVIPSNAFYLGSITNPNSSDWRVFYARRQKDKGE